MAYCQADEVREMIKDDALNTLIGDEYIEDPQEREMKIIPIIEDAIADASGEIDGYLAKRYPVPLPQPPKIINKLSKDIAVYNLFSRIGIDEKEKEKNYLNRYNAAIKFLTLIAEGKVDVGVSDNQSSAQTGFAGSSNERLFSRKSMRGM